MRCQNFLMRYLLRRRCHHNMEENIEYEMPLTDDIYCWTCLVEEENDKKFYTLLVGPLLKVWISAGPAVLESTLGIHRFIATTDRPMYLIPYDDPIADKYGKKVKFDLHTTDPEEPDDIVVPMEFEFSVAPFFQYKILNGQLYKKEGKEWKLQSI